MTGKADITRKWGSVRFVHQLAISFKTAPSRSENWQSEHRTWQQRGGYNGYRIPDDRFRGYFGPSHGFRIRGLPLMYEGEYPRFQYRGY
jgi:hypothetical protein